MNYPDDMKQVVAAAMSVVEVQGIHRPMFMIETDNGMELMMITSPMTENEHKDEVVELVREEVEKLNADTYYFASSGDMVKTDDVQTALQDIKDSLDELSNDEIVERVTDLMKSPSKNPLKQDVLTVSKFNKKTGTDTAIIPYSTDDDGNIKWGKPEQPWAKQKKSYNRFNIWTPVQYNLQGSENDV